MFVFFMFVFYMIASPAGRDVGRCYSVDASWVLQPMHAVIISSTGILCSANLLLFVPFCSACGLRACLYAWLLHIRSLYVHVG
jgi:hypothetical protein